ncbi:hypothetical protein BDV96DRAFT_608072 [Lophiotrema nucula]|uniref:Uncharacterized protein n=1 Tax=Lophiotrema nucula TaxID=690887 RepID=A0A6A5YHP5_9PLEO|nr:hypothetical protein BDV96DRAFT_608072 [Lophiotrema nucula]
MHLVGALLGYALVGLLVISLYLFHIILLLVRILDQQREMTARIRKLPREVARLRTKDSGTDAATTKTDMMRTSAEGEDSKAAIAPSSTPKKPKKGATLRTLS